MATVLQLKDFTKSYDGQKPAVDHVSLEVEEGEIFGFIGHNGAANLQRSSRLLASYPPIMEKSILMGKHFGKPRKNARKRWHISRIIPICMNI